MDDVVALRCKYCGAPLDETQVRSDAQFVTCEFCGTTQQRIDARKYMEDMVNQVKDWVAKSMPVGFGSGGMENVDPVARHSIFVKDVRPKLVAELDQFRFSNMSLLGNCLLAMPFRTARTYRPDYTPNCAFEFNAKARSVAPMAVSDEDKEIIDEATVISESYALVANNLNLLAEKKDGRWGIMAKNYRESSKTLSKNKKYSLPSRRFDALGDVCEGFERIMSGNAAEALTDVRRGKDKLMAIYDNVMSDPQFMLMFSALEQEVSITRMAEDMLLCSENSGKDIVQMMDIVDRVMDVSDAGGGKWNYLLKGQDRYWEVFGSISDAISATADGTIPVAAGDGDILMPFWEVDLRYTFTTGKLWKKKSVEVKEDLLICADFPGSDDCLKRPSRAVTDIFADRPECSAKDSFLGNEVSISAGQGIGRIQDSVSDAGAGSRKVILPMSTKREAEKLMMAYLDERAGTIQQFKLCDPVVSRLIYVPCRLQGNRFVLPKDFGVLVPEHIKDLDGSSVLMV
ncbi:MAG: hypothetical protein ACI4Q9_01160 [Candidatus Methanomethylophilaceae archaeon]